MSEVQSIIKNVQSSGTWDSPHGMLYKFDYEFEDGMVLSANHKTEQPVAAGSEAFYTVTGENNFGKRGKVSRTSTANFNGGGAPQAQAPRSNTAPRAVASASGDKDRAFALSYAKDLAVANLNSSVVAPYGSNAQLMEELFLNADTMLIWLKK